MPNSRLNKKSNDDDIPQKVVSPLTNDDEQQQQRPTPPPRALSWKQQRVTLNVGGTRFETLQSTLTAHSPYFEARFSAEWCNNSSDDDDDDVVCFLDHDPATFRTLLSFFRYGYIEAADLTKEVLVLADYLEVTKLVAAAKCLVMKNHHRRRLCGAAPPNDENLSDVELVEQFDRDGWSFHAMPARVLEQCIRTAVSDETRKRETFEYASLYVHKPSKDFPVHFSAPPYRAGIKSLLFLPHNGNRRNHHHYMNYEEVWLLRTASTDTNDGEDHYQYPSNDAIKMVDGEPHEDSGGFLLPVYALNWLGKQGFRVAPAHMQAFQDDKRLQPPSPDDDKQSGFDPERDDVIPITPDHLGEFLGELLFVRKRRDDDDNAEDGGADAATSIDRVIVPSAETATATSSHHHEEHPREYATLNAVKRMTTNDVFIQCAGGEPQPTMPRLVGGGVFDVATSSSSSVRQLRRIGRLHTSSIVTAMDWLERHGFYQREPQLETFLSKAQTETSDGFYGPTLVFSRPLCEHQPLLPESQLISQSMEDMVRVGDNRMEWRRVEGITR